jgi:hypothetical protein
MKGLANFLLLFQFFTAPDGAGGGGTPGGAPLEDWIKRLNEAEKKDRKTIVEEMAQALGVTIGDVYKLLKEAGWDSKNNKPEPPAGGSAAGGNPSPGSGGTPPVKKEAVQVTLRHKSPYPHYRRAGLLLTNQFKP